MLLLLESILSEKALDNSSADVGYLILDKLAYAINRGIKALGKSVIGYKPIYQIL